MHPLYDTRNLSDDDILEKLAKCYRYLDMQSSLGHDATVASIQETIMALELERNGRFEKTMQEEEDKLNLDPLKPIELGKLDTDEQDGEE